MGIIWGSENETMRSDVIELLERASKVRKLKILDAGGGLNSWLGHYVTHVIDSHPASMDEKVAVVIGDINDASTWQSFEDNEFDFISSTHTLEDIRDPKFVISQFSRVARAGFIAVPNRRSEFQNIESNSYLGYSHHRWIFHLRERDKLEAVAKWIGISNSKSLTEHFVGNRKRFMKKKNFSKLLPATLQQTDENFLELGLIWEDQLQFEYFNDDFAGESSEIMKKNSLSFLAEPFVDFALSYDWQSKLYSVISKE